MRRQYFDYRPRPQFRAFHRRKERFACIITHRRYARRTNRNSREVIVVQQKDLSERAGVKKLAADLKKRQHMSVK